MKVKIHSGNNHVKDVRCPACSKETVVYNGNYFCEHCTWAMGERRTPAYNLIIHTYLNQCFEAAEDKNDQKTMDLMKFYMENM